MIVNLVLHFAVDKTPNPYRIWSPIPRVKGMHRPVAYLYGDSNFSPAYASDPWDDACHILAPR